MNCVVIYHYFPRFRIEIFEALRSDSDVDYSFIYGRNSRFGVPCVVDERDSVKSNFFLGNFVIQSVSYRDIRRVARSSSVILGDIKFLNSWLYAIIGRLSGRKVYFWTHGALQSEGWLKTRVRRVFYSLAHELLLYSNNEQKLLKQEGYRTPISVIGNANFSDAVRQDEYRCPRTKDCFYVGRVTREKQLQSFIDFAVASPHRRFAIVGDGDAKDDLVEYCSKRNCGNLRFLGAIYDTGKLSEELWEYKNLIFFTPIGLSCFTAVLLGKRIFVRAGTTHKPEFHILKKYGLIEEFRSIEQLEELLNIDYDEASFWANRERFLNENSASAVSMRITRAVNCWRC